MSLGLVSVLGDKSMVFPKHGIAVSECSRKEMKISVLAMACRLLCYQCSWEQLGVGADVICCQPRVFSTAGGLSCLAVVESHNRTESG